tara:strand:- start:1151 stop:2500 length:1350 start_codon:yes stop_codon:yes gene_type:complete
MTHFLKEKKYKSQISDKDYNIIFSGKKKKITPEFGSSPRDYIEMNVFNSNGVRLDTIKVGEVSQYIDGNGNFKINPGIIMRRNGYFSGDYDIEFNFLREIAGSNKTVLLDRNNEIYTGEFDVLIDGRIVKKDNPKSELKEIDYKYYIEDISNDKKEVRLATLPIKNEIYKKEFMKLVEAQSNLYPKVAVNDNLVFENPKDKVSNIFTIKSNSNLQVDESMVGSELVINDAYEILDLSELSVENDGFSIGAITKRYSLGHLRPGDNGGAAGLAENLIDNYYDERCFKDIGSDSDGDEENKMADYARETWLEHERILFGGAYVTGYRTAQAIGFPCVMDITLPSLNNISSLNPNIVVTMRGYDLVDTSNTFESKSEMKFKPGKKQTIPIPTFHKRFGGLYSAQFDLTFDLNGKRRGLTIYRPNLLAVIPDFVISNENIRPAEPFIRAGANW